MGTFLLGILVVVNVVLLVLLAAIFRRTYRLFANR